MHVGFAILCIDTVFFFGSVPSIRMKFINIASANPGFTEQDLSCWRVLFVQIVIYKFHIRFRSRKRCGI